MQHNPNKIITDALNTSPFARAIHDKLYPEKFYTYGVAPVTSDQNGERLAFVMLWISKHGMVQAPKLAFDVNGSYAQGVSGIHHEINHILQMKNNKTSGLDKLQWVQSLDSNINQILVMETQAFGLQYEGPIRGLIKTLEVSNDNDLGKYQDLFVYLEDYGQQDSQREFLLTLFNNETDQICTRSGFDSKGLSALRAFSHKPIEEKEARLYRARKQQAKTFLYTKFGGNSEVTEAYIQKEIVDYQTRRKKQKGELLLPQNPLLTDVLQATEMCDGTEFLSKRDWCDVLGGKNTRDVVQRLISQSRHASQYNSVKNLSYN
jgi:hypothetical protein